MAPLLFLPGLGGSGPRHWQSQWRAELGGAVIAVSDWERPILRSWLRAADEALAATNGRPILVAHSLGCLLAAHWLGTRRSQGLIAGAFLAAVPDPAAASFPDQVSADFARIPGSRLPCPSIVIASTDDPFGSVAFSVAVAQRWASRLVDVGRAGHLNMASGHGPWPEGRILLHDFNMEVSSRQTS